MKKLVITSLLASFSCALFASNTTVSPIQIPSPTQVSYLQEIDQRSPLNVPINRKILSDTYSYNITCPIHAKTGSGGTNFSFSAQNLGEYIPTFSSWPSLTPKPINSEVHYAISEMNGQTITFSQVTVNDNGFFRINDEDTSHILVIGPCIANAIG